MPFHNIAKKVQSKTNLDYFLKVKPSGSAHLEGHTVPLAVHSPPWSCSADMGPFQDASVLLRTDVVTEQRLTGGNHKEASEDFSA